VALSKYQGVGDWGDNSWATPDTLGTAQVLYIENNSFTSLGGVENDVAAWGGGSFGGIRIACRYNTYNPSAASGICSSAHGTSWNGRNRGTRHSEAYRNTVTDTNKVGDTVSGSVAGTLYYFQNTDQGYFNSLVKVDNERDWRTSKPVFGYCDGSEPWDTNDGVVYAAGTVTATGSGDLIDSNASWAANQWSPVGVPYSGRDVTQGFGGALTSNTANTAVFVGEFQYYNAWTAGDSYQILRAAACIDQPGRGMGALLTGSSANLVSTGSPGPVAQVLDPIYVWNNSHSDPTYNSNPVSVGSANPRLIANREWYAESLTQAAQTSPTSPFNGTSGMGHGTLANCPTTCTTGVGYWATDQGNWNQSGDGFGQGELFVCTAPNTWTLYYIPYVYPHPLVSGAPPPPTITAFSASPATITAGQSTTLSWTVTGDTSLSMTQGIGNVFGQSSVTVSPSLTTIYTLTAVNSGGCSFQNVTVTVSSSSSGGGNPSSTFVPRVYPNPWRSDRHAGKNITFDGLTSGTDIKIFTVSGHKVAELQTDGPSVPWTLTNNAGDKVASGVYLYVITDNAGDKVRGKVAVIR